MHISKKLLLTMSFLVLFMSSESNVCAVETLNNNTENVIIIQSEPYIPEYTKEEIELLALVTMAEAEGEPEDGKRLVIDTILNRVDNLYFPDTISDVIYQKNQFSSMWNGRVDRCYVSDDIVTLVEEEIENRTNSKIVFFHAGRYSDYGSPTLQIGNHYFSTYK